MMNAVLRILCPGALAVLAACSTTGMDARYEQSLAKWKGASSAQLETAWGRPQSSETLQGTMRALTWVVHHDMQDQGRIPVVIVSPGSGSVIMQPGVPMAPTVPVTCKTRFVLVDDAVVSWTFDGIACGAP